MISRAKIWTADPSKSSRRGSDQAAFVLLELVAVLAIIALVAAVATMSLRVPLQKARLERVLSALEDADRRARREAERSGSTVEFTIDRDHTRSSTAVFERDIEKRSLPLSGNLHIARCLSGRGAEGADRLAVRMSANGRSPTYAIRVNTSHDDRRSRHEWLVVIGATEQYIRETEDSVVEAIVLR